MHPPSHQFADSQRTLPPTNMRTRSFHHISRMYHEPSDFHFMKDECQVLRMQYGTGAAEPSSEDRCPRTTLFLRSRTATGRELCGRYDSRRETRTQAKGQPPRTNALRQICRPLTFRRDYGFEISPEPLRWRIGEAFYASLVINDVYVTTCINASLYYKSK